MLIKNVSSTIHPSIHFALSTFHLSPDISSKMISSHTAISTNIRVPKILIIISTGEREQLALHSDISLKKVIFSHRFTTFL